MLLPDGFIPVPHHPSYMVRQDGRVYSLRTNRILAESGRGAVWKRVTIDRVEVRVRDLVWLTFGSTSEFSERIEAES